MLVIIVAVVVSCRNNSKMKALTEQLLNAGTVLSKGFTYALLIYLATLKDMYYNGPYYTRGQTEVQSGYITCQVHKFPPNPCSYYYTILPLKQSLFSLLTSNQHPKFLSLVICHPRTCFYFVYVLSTEDFY